MTLTILATTPIRESLEILESLKECENPMAADRP
jgi:hypothetical protein